MSFSHIDLYNLQMQSSHRNSIKARKRKNYNNGGGQTKPRAWYVTDCAKCNINFKTDPDKTTTKCVKCGSLV